MINHVYITLPVKDIAVTKNFWQQLGFKFNRIPSDDKAASLILKEDVHVMFIQENYFQTFSSKPLSSKGSCSVLLSINLNSKKEVDVLVNAALELGAYQHEEAEDHGWMYQNSFWDIDDFGWNVTFHDLSKMPI